MCVARVYLPHLNCITRFVMMCCNVFQDVDNKRVELASPYPSIHISWFALLDSCYLIPDYFCQLLICHSRPMETRSWFDITSVVFLKNRYLIVSLCGYLQASNSKDLESGPRIRIQD